MWGRVRERLSAEQGHPAERMRGSEAPTHLTEGGVRGDLQMHRKCRGHFCRCIEWGAEGSDCARIPHGRL